MAVEFPEHDFHPARERRDGYARRIRDGRACAAQSSVIFCGLARDCAAMLTDGTIPTIERLGSAFRSWRAVICENDSSDDTGSILDAWASRDPRVHVISWSDGCPRWPQTRDPARGTYLAVARNRYLDWLRANHLGARYVVVLDLDVGRHSLDGLLSALVMPVRWDAIASNGLIAVKGRYVQYDAWAWRRHGAIDTPLPNSVINRIVPRRGDPPIRVASAFGGLAVYKSASILTARYAGGDCEHTALHRSMANVWVSPDLITLYPPRA